MSCCFHNPDVKLHKDHTGHCQFENETDFFEVDGKKYCKFHMPLTYGVNEPTQKKRWKDKEIETFNQLLSLYCSELHNKYGRLFLIGVVFPNSVSVDLISNNRDIQFHFCTFSNGFNFSNNSLLFNVVFNNSTLSSVNLTKCAFNAFLSFEDCEFSHGRSNFEKCVYFKRASFKRTIFRNGANFEYAVFHDVAVFSESIFDSSVNFDEARFESDVNFAKTHFKGGATFWLTYFGQVTTFDGALIEGGFDISTRDQEKNRENSVISYPSFKDCVFVGQADFENRIFLNSTSFEGAIFKLAPKFHNVAFHQDTDFQNSIFEDYHSDHASRAYRTLKLAMGAVRARNEEAMFYAFEQKALRHRNDTPLRDKIVSFCYEWASDYGRNFIKPLLILCVFTMLFLVGYKIWAGAPDGPTFGEVTSFTIEQIVRPFSVWTERYAPPAGLSHLFGEQKTALRLVATFQSLLSIGFLTLFVLAVRRRFRLN